MAIPNIAKIFQHLNFFEQFVKCCNYRLLTPAEWRVLNKIVCFKGHNDIKISPPNQQYCYQNVALHIANRGLISRYKLPSKQYYVLETFIKVPCTLFGRLMKTFIIRLFVEGFGRLYNVLL